jgi:hypothetical protein
MYLNQKAFIQRTLYIVATTTTSKKIEEKPLEGLTISSCRPLL